MEPREKKDAEPSGMRERPQARQPGKDLSRYLVHLADGMGAFMPRPLTSMDKAESVFSIPQVMVITAFIVSLVGLSGWLLNLEMRKADRAEIIGRAYRESLDRTLSDMQEDLRYLRRRMDQLNDIANRRDQYEFERRDRK